MYYVDWNMYPKGNSIREIADVLESMGYWEKAIEKDPWGNYYNYEKNNGKIRVISYGKDKMESADDISIEGSFQDEIVEQAVNKERMNKQPAKANISSTIYSLLQSTLITVSKSANDILVSWSQNPTHTYTVTRSIDAQFFNAVSLAVNLDASSFTYLNALLNDRDVEFIVVSDDNSTEEENPGNENNGGEPPASVPVIITPAGTLYIGGQGTISGYGLSNVRDDNSIWFEGGVKAKLTGIAPGPPIQLDFTVPPGAVSGDMSVCVGGDLTSDMVQATVHLEDPAGSWTTRSIGFAEGTRDYWGAGSWSGNQRFVRIYYDSGSGKWMKEDKSGAYLGNVLYCSTKTDRFGRLFCGYGTLGTGGGGTRKADTSSASNLGSCINLGGSGNQVNVRGAAADPNPLGIEGRDVAYFAFHDDTTGKNYIKKIKSDCSAIVKDDYGNFGGGLVFNVIVGMSVDLDGNLYVVSNNSILKIDLSENVTTVVGGFSNLYGIDVLQEGVGAAPVYILMAEAGTSQIKAKATDNTAAPIALASASTARTVAWSMSTFSEWDVSKIERSIFVHNSGTLLAVRGDYRLIVEPRTLYDGKVYISSPVATDKPPNQKEVRLSYAPGSNYSTVEVRAWWRDGKARALCGYTGEPRSIAPYEPETAPAERCDRPWDSIGLPCDNKENFTANAQGSFVETGNFQYCTTSACGSNKADACRMHVRISQRYSGDNYKVYFNQYSGSAKIASATAHLTAWKHIHIEKDKMCRKGGIIKGDANAGSQIIYLAMNNDGSQADNVNQGDIIHIIDSLHTLEAEHDIACVKSRVEDAVNKKVIIELGNQQNCNQDYLLNYFYDSDDNAGANDPWEFDSGKSAGVCVEGSGFYEANTSDLRQPFNDGFASFHIPMQIANGAGVVPYIPSNFFDYSANRASILRFHQVWFQNKHEQGCDLADSEAPCYISAGDCSNCCNAKDNYWHLLASSRDIPGSFGHTCRISDFSAIDIGRIETRCGANNVCTTNVNISTTDHEIVHQFGVNLEPPCSGEHDPGAEIDQFNLAWCGSPPGGAGTCGNQVLGGTRCLMSGADDATQWDHDQDEYNRMDCEDIAGIAVACGLQSCGGNSVRTQQDPF